MLPVEVLKQDHALRLAARDQGNTKGRLGPLAPQELGSHLGSPPLQVLIDKQGLPCAKDMSAEAARGVRLREHPLALLDHIAVVHHVSV